MLDKRLTRDISDLLELNVSDDKIIRIMMVRGFTTEQVRRSIKEIRNKEVPIEGPAQKSAPVSETIETGPSKRFGMLDKVFGKSQTDEEILAEEEAKLIGHEKVLRDEEVRVHEEVQRLENETLHAPTSVPEDVREVLRLMDTLLEKLPDKEVERFSKSPQFEKYRAVMRKYAPE